MNAMNDFATIMSGATVLAMLYPSGATPKEALAAVKARLREIRKKGTGAVSPFDKAMASATDPYGFNRNLRRIAYILCCNKLTQLIGGDTELVARLTLSYGVLASGFLINLVFSALKTRQIAPEACDRYLHLKGHFVSLIVLDVLFAEKAQALGLGHFADMTSSIILVPVAAFAGWYRAGNSKLLKLALTLGATVSVAAQWAFHHPEQFGDPQRVALGLSTFAFMVALRATADSDVPPFQVPEPVRRLVNDVVRPLVAEIVNPIAASAAAFVQTARLVIGKIRGRKESAV